MATGNLTSSIRTILKCFLVTITLASSTGYPFFTGKQYYRTVPIRRSYVSIPINRYRNEYQLPEYEDPPYLPVNQYNYEYNNVLDKYPFVQYIGYYPDRNYYNDKMYRKNSESYEYFDDRNTQESDDDDDIITDDNYRQEKPENYPYGQETWYKEELPTKYDDRNAEANAAFLQNLILAQMYQDAKNRYTYGYGENSDDYDHQQWFYGVPTTEVDEKEKVKQYFKNKEDEEVKELESLARKKGKSKKLKGKELPSYNSKQKNIEIIEKPTKSKSKMTDDEYFDLQKQIIVNNRKNNFLSNGDDYFKINKKQNYDYSTGDVMNNNNNFWDSYKQTNNNKKIKNLSNSNNKNSIRNEKNLESETTTSSTILPSSSSATINPSFIGQKEVVLPRPSNPVRRRRPFDEISSRSLSQPSVYDTIKKLLNMEKELQRVSLYLK